MDDVVLNKVATIERCILRIHEEHAGDDAVLDQNITKQDSIVLNLQRACEASIDLAMHLVRLGRFGIPQDSRDAFELLVKHASLDSELAHRMKRMVGFRNVAVHDYQALNLDVVRSILREHVSDLERFSRWSLSSSLAAENAPLAL